MKLGRNEPCPCGSGKKYKRCCIDQKSAMHAEVFDEAESLLAMNPNLSLDELNVVLQRKVEERNNHPLSEFCGLSPVQISNWMNSPLENLEHININTPNDFSASPVMSYLTLIIETAMANGGKFKATAKGNLPVKIVKQASELLPSFAVAKHEAIAQAGEFDGINEDKFDALHYSRVLAELTGVIYYRGGHYHVKKAAQKQYQKEGIQAFFKTMLKVATGEYNWGYLDGMPQPDVIRPFWVFMLWRLQNHCNVDRLSDEVSRAFPTLLSELQTNSFFTKKEQLDFYIQVRFIQRFLQYWGFVTYPPKRFSDPVDKPQIVQLQPLFKATFHFDLK